MYMPFREIGLFEERMQRRCMGAAADLRHFSYFSADGLLISGTRQLLAP